MDKRRNVRAKKEEKHQRVVGLIHMVDVLGPFGSGR